MPSRDKNGNEVFSQAEYEHFNFIGEPFRGLVEGIGYACTDTEIVASPFNRSGTHVMLDIQLIQYTFDVSDVNYNDEPTLSSRDQADKTPDRSDYTRVPSISKYEYDGLAWYDPTIAAVFIDNIFIDLVNPMISLANSAIVPPQIMYHEGFGAFMDNEVAGAKGMMNAPVNYAINTYNYAVNTPFSKQMSDLGRDFSNPHKWEEGFALGGSLLAGGYGVASKAGFVGKSTGMLRGGATLAKRPYPFVTTFDGFLFKGFNVKTPFNIPVQRFGYINPNATQFWGLRIGSNKFVNRSLAAIKVEWNPLTNYTQGYIPKGTAFKFGMIGPQYPIWRHPGGSLQFRIETKHIMIQSTKTVNTK